MGKIESDEALVHRFHAGDDSAFDLLCERYRKSVYTSCYAILVGEDLATDVASQTFTEAMRELRNGQVPADPHTWLRAKARRLAIDRADPRMERRSRSVDIDPEWQAAVGERGQLVWDAVTSLSLSHRKVLNLRIPLELTVEQIAEVLHIDQSMARRLMDDADRELRAALVGLIVARSARRQCGTLDGLLTAAGWTAGHFHAESRTYRTVADHIEQCEACTEVRAKTYLASDWLRIVIPLLAIPEELVRRIIEETQEMAIRATSTEAVPASALAPTGALTSTGASLSQPLNKLVQFVQTGRAAVSVTASRMAASPIFTKAANILHENPVIARTAGLVSTLVLLGPLVLAGSQPSPETHRPDVRADPPPATASPSPAASSPDNPTTQPPPPQAPPVDPAKYEPPQAPPGNTSVPPPPSSEPQDNPLPPQGESPPDDQPPPDETPPDETPPDETPPDETPPPKWGYALGSALVAPLGTERRVTTNYSGSWKRDPDPAVAGRVPMLTHDAVGSFQVRFPAIGSTQGVAHVSTAWWAYSDSCVIKDQEIVDGDEVVRVHCFTITGAPRDIGFALVFAEADDRSVNTADSAIQVRHNGTGRYTAVLDGTGRTGLGYVQVTAKGDKPARCQNAGVRKVGATVEIELLCHTVSSAAPLTDTEWTLTYTERGSLTSGVGVPAAYVQTTPTAPGLRVDADRSYNSTGGAMTVLRDAIGLYRVGFKGIGITGIVPQVIPIGPEVGECSVSGWGFPVPGEVWMYVYCYNNHAMADRPFGIALIRSPGTATGALNPTPPGPHPAGPKWAHARISLATNNIPVNVETEVKPEDQWGTWVRNLSEVDARWARRVTVLRQDVGRYRVLLPGVGSPAGIPHLTVDRMYTFSGTCAVQGYQQLGIDEEITVACFWGGPGLPAQPGNLPFSVFFSAPPEGGAPAATIRYPVSTPDTVNSTGRPIQVSRAGTGTYVATVDSAAFDATGYPQVTPYQPDGPAPVWCRATGTERTLAGMRIAVSCWDYTVQAQPKDSPWLLTYAQGTPLTHDPAVPGAYLRTTASNPVVEPAYSYSSTGGAMRVLRVDTGRYLVGFRAIGNGGNTIQVSMVGPDAGQCLDSGSDHYVESAVAWFHVSCFDSWRRVVDAPFSVAILSSPYGVRGTPSPPEPGPQPAVPAWGYAYMHATDRPFDVETMLNPAYPWGSWLGTLDPYQARWWPQSTVIRKATGVSLVRLPRVGSAQGIPHVTVVGTAAAGDSCVIESYEQSGVDELVQVRCFDNAGRPKDMRFFVFFGESANTVRVTQLGTGHYQATVDGPGLDPAGYPQLTPLTDKAVRCRATGTDRVGAGVRVDVICNAIGPNAPPADAGLLLTYVHNTTLSRDPRLPGAYVQTTPAPVGLDNARSYNSSGGSITVETLATGQFRVRIAGIARTGDNGFINSTSGQVVVRGPNPGSCFLLGLGHQDGAASYGITQAIVYCYDPSGRPADLPFGLAVVRRP